MAEDSLPIAVEISLKKLRAEREEKIKKEAESSVKEEEKNEFIKKEEIINENIPEISVKKENNEENFVRNQMFIELANKNWMAFNQNNFNFAYMMGMYFAYMSLIFPNVSRG